MPKIKLQNKILLNLIGLSYLGRGDLFYYYKKIKSTLNTFLVEFNCQNVNSQA
jgi:hypothetical protein